MEKEQVESLTQRQEKIIQASIKLISDGGIQHLTIKALAAEVGVSEPAIYRHFKSKMDILKTLLSMIQEESRRFRNKISQEEPSLKQIEAMFTTHTRQFIANPALTSIIFSEEIFQNDKKLSDVVLTIMNEKQEFIHSVIEREQQAGQVRTDISADKLTLIIMGTLRLIVSRWKLTNFKFDLNAETREAWMSLSSMLVV
jgi:AcrR family transcriptional regulator